MSDPIYKKEVLRLAADAAGAGRLQAPDTQGVAHNPSCGDKSVVQLTVANGSVVAMAHDTRACVLSQASAAILGANLTGRQAADVRALLAEVNSMLQGHAAVSPPFADYAVFEGVAEFKNRHRCVTLPIEATLAAFENLQTGEKNSVAAEHQGLP